MLSIHSQRGCTRSKVDMCRAHLDTCRAHSKLACVQDTLVAGLLHDTVEDTKTVTLAQIEESFGYECMRIVEGETKFSKLTQLQQPKSHSSKEDEQVRNDTTLTCNHTPSITHLLVPEH